MAERGQEQVFGAVVLAVQPAAGDERRRILPERLDLPAELKPQLRLAQREVARHGDTGRVRQVAQRRDSGHMRRERQLQLEEPDLKRGLVALPVDQIVRLDPGGILLLAVSALVEVLVHVIGPAAMTPGGVQQQLVPEEARLGRLLRLMAQVAGHLDGER